MPKRKPKKIHPNALHLTVANVPRAAAFYVDKFGFKISEAFPDTSKPVWVNLVLGRQSVMLGELPTLQEARDRGMEREEIELLKQDARSIARGALGVGIAYYLQVKNIDAFARKLRKKRVRMLTSPKTQAHGLRDCQVNDLDGYRLIFYTRVEVPEPASEAAS